MPFSVSPRNTGIPIYLFYYEGYTAVEIAGILKRSENTILHLVRPGAKEELKSSWEVEWDGK